jgi:hypothetical protein
MNLLIYNRHHPFFFKRIHHMAMKNYKRVLQTSFSLTDRCWEYVVPNLPDRKQCDQAGYVKHCALVSNVAAQELRLSFSKNENNRALSDRPLHSFIHMACADFRLQLEDGNPATFRETADYLARLLKAGIIINGTHYHFYGHSNSQLKSKSCILMAGSKEQVNSHVESLGNFSTMKSVAKKAKRIGLLFSTAHSVTEVDPSRCRDIEDVENDGYIFTDGCGLISPALTKVLDRKRNITHRNQQYHPSVFQIRYRGYKGVVIKEPRMEINAKVFRWI